MSGEWFLNIRHSDIGKMIGLAAKKFVYFVHRRPFAAAM